MPSQIDFIKPKSSKNLKDSKIAPIPSINKTIKNNFLKKLIAPRVVGRDKLSFSQALFLIAKLNK
ncbi:hypothetical protein PF022_07385 [Helicobacter sp. WB40]|nr:hypothetical protein [Helicobacter sp. WB40]MDA3967779.1 hypothetical protein [Helicobacter sp. WB40]